MTPFMHTHPLPVDLNLFRQAVLDHGPEACLPANLGDDWLFTLNDELAGNGGAVPAAALLAVALLLLGRPGGAPGPGLMECCLADFHREIILEIVSRHTILEYTPATLTTIFTRREIDLARREPFLSAGEEAGSACEDLPLR